MIERLFSFSGPDLVLLAGGLFGLYVGYCQVVDILDPLHSIPGPWAARFTRLWYLYQIYRGTYERVNITLHKRYGPIVRIAPGEYSIDHVEAAKIIYGHGSSFLKAPWYYAWTPADPERAGLFSDLNPHRHAAQRRKFASAYAMSTLVNYEPYVDGCTALLKERFCELATSGRTIDLFHWLQCYAFDVIGEITFGERFGLLTTGEDNAGIFQAIQDRTNYGTFVGIYPGLNNIIFPLLPSTGGFRYVVDFSAARISDKVAGLNDLGLNSRDGPLDFVSKFVAAHNENPEKITGADLQMICFSNIAAGSDTTAISLSSVLYQLIKHPESFRDLREEIDTAAREGRIDDPVTFKQAQEHLPFLQAVIKEATRLHPAVGLGLQRVVPAGGAELAGRYFPAGTTVGINPWVAHRNQTHFGKDADIWRPERWMENGSGDLEKYNLTFGMGSRTCVGKNISLLEMTKLIPQLVRSFDFQLEEGLLGMECETENRWFVKQVNLKGKVVNR